ncbi:MAG: hypothetical protein Q9167_006776 [Letrouitia subvulpina]
MTLTSSQIISFQKHWYAVGILEPTIFAASKLSILLLYRRIFATLTFQAWTRVVGVFIALSFVGNLFADAFFCIPIRKNWEPEAQGHCGNKHLLIVLPPIAGILTDIMLLLMPLPMLRTLHVPRAQKFGLAGLFFLGGFAIVASCIRYSTLFFKQKDVTYDIATATVWTVIESNMIIICACLIASRPFFVRIYPQKLISHIQEMTTKKSSSDKDDRSGTRRLMFGRFRTMTNTPPAMTNLSLGQPFKADLGSAEADFEKAQNVDPAISSVRNKYND